MKNLFLLLLVTSALFACGNDNKELLIGKWREVETGSSLTEFRQDGTYTVEYDDGSNEKGKWRIKGQTIFTIEDGTSDELSEEIAELNEKNLIVQVSGFGMTLQTKYKREN